MTDFFSITPCSGTEACAITPKSPIKLDLLTLSKNFEKILAATPLVLVIEIEGIEASIHPTGKLLIKSRDEKVINRIALKIYEKIM